MFDTESRITQALQEYFNKKNEKFNNCEINELPH